MLQEPVASEEARALSPPPPTSPPRVFPVWLAFVLLMMCVVGGNVVLVVIAMVAGYPPDQLMKMPGFLPATVAISETSLLAAAVFVLFLVKDAPAGWKARVAWHPERFNILDAVLLFLAATCAGGTLDDLARLSGIKSTSLTQINDAVRSAGPLETAFIIPLFTLAPGFCEELFFRGVAQQRFVERHGFWPGIVLASALFGTIHMDPVHAPLAMAIGLVLGWGAQKSGTIWNGMFAHALNNGLSYLSARYDLVPSDSQRVFWLAGEVVVALAALAVLRIRWRAGQ